MRQTGSARQPLIYRSFAVGDLADLVMLDTRLIGRDEQVDRANVLAVEDPRRSILGPAQEGWTTDHGYAADAVVWMTIAPAAPWRAASSYL